MRRRPPSSRSLRPRRSKRYSFNIRRLVFSVLIILLAVEAGIIAFTSPWFSIKSVETVGNEIIPSKQIVSLLRDELGSNIFLINKRQISSRLAKLPPMERVRIYRRLPDALVVKVDERKPDLVLNSAGTLYEVDSTGVPFRTVKEPAADLPVLSLAMSIKIVLGQPIREPSFEMAKKCLLMVRAKKNFEVAEISIDQNDDLCLNVRDGFLVKLGRPEQLSEKLDKAAIAADEMPGFRRHGEYIDVTCLEAPALKFKQ